MLCLAVDGLHDTTASEELLPPRLQRLYQTLCHTHTHRVAMKSVAVQFLERDLPEGATGKCPKYQAAWG